MRTVLSWSDTYCLIFVRINPTRLTYTVIFYTRRTHKIGMAVASFELPAQHRVGQFACGLVHLNLRQCTILCILFKQQARSQGGFGGFDRTPLQRQKHDGSCIKSTRGRAFLLLFRVKCR